MRDIKFRAWDKVKGKWVEGAYGFHILGEAMIIGGLFSDWSIERLNDIILEQFTGHKDRNGEDIYHHDIIKKIQDEEYTPDNCKKYGGAIGTVMYSLWPFSEFVIELINGEEYSFYYPDGTNFSVEELEVIGNIHENPELIKEN
jgi:uncharacterized phage protein (TIGR01671 family)